MLRYLSLLMLVLLLSGCASAPAQSAGDVPIVGTTKIGGKTYPRGDSSGPHLQLNGLAASEDYGYTPDDPIRVGGADTQEGPRNERLFLSALLGPDGQPIHYERVGSCCAFETPDSGLGIGLLDVYEITYEGLKKPVTLYLNMYDSGELFIPRGFTARD